MRYGPGHLAAAFLIVACTTGACSEDGAAPGDEDASTAGRGEGGGGGSGGGSAAGGGQDSDSGLPELQADPGCDLTGKWISVRRMITYTLDKIVKQSGHNFGYWEIEQQGTEAVVARGLRCGMIVVDRSDPLYSTVSASQALWDGITSHTSEAGRRVVAGSVGEGECFVRFERGYAVRGATVPHFENPEVPLSDAAVPAKGDRPGWEDWDQDGHPGVTFGVSGVANGNLYVVQRDWCEWEGTVPADADRFRLEVAWNTEQLVLETDPPGFPVPDAWASTEPGENYTWFQRVDDSMTGQTDLETCANMRAVKEELLPEGFE